MTTAPKPGYARLAGKRPYLVMAGEASQRPLAAHPDRRRLSDPVATWWRQFPIAAVLVTQIIANYLNLLVPQR